MHFNAIVVVALAYLVIVRAADAALQRLGDLAARRTRLYARAWQLAVAGGTGFAILVALATIH